MAKDKKEPAPDVATYTLRLPRALMAALESYCASQRFPPNKQTVIENLLVQFLTDEGFRPASLEK